MHDLREALSEIHSIRGYMVRCVEFRGYGPATLASTGVLALAAASLQEILLAHPAQSIVAYLSIWITTAALALTLIGIETLSRARRMHAELAMPMVDAAFGQFLPPIVAGLLMTVVLLRSAPQSLWMLPGLWQILFSMGVFASCRILPRQIFAVGVWYLAAGLACLVLGQGGRSFSPWAMGVPFGVGQLLVAGVLQFGYRKTNAEE